MRKCSSQSVQKKSEIFSTRPPELRTSNIFSSRSERSSFTLRSRRQWRCRLKPNTANVRRSCRSEGDQQSNKIATVMNNIHQLKIPAHRLNRSTSAQEINKHVSDDVRAENKPKIAKTKEAKDFSKSEAELVDVMDTLQHSISIIEKEIAKNPAFLQKEIDTRNTNNARVALINSLQQTGSMMRHTTEQITDVSCGNTAASVVFDQFL